MSIKALIGLGNPGANYKFTRHNIGFSILEELAEKHDVPWEKKPTLEAATINLNTPNSIHTIILIKPQTYMNNSGDITPFLKKNSILPSEMLVIHDELEKPFGKQSIKQGGSARGHNGLRSLIQKIGDSFWRFRFGIGRPEQREDVPDFVLNPFSKEEKERLPALIEESIQHIELFCIK